MKTTILAAMLLLFMSSKGQVYQTIQINNSLKLAGYQVTGISNDSTGANQSATKLITEYAAKKLVLGRFTLATPLTRFTDSCAALRAAIGSGGGGSATYAGLTDVSLTSIANGQLVRWNSTSSKWENFTPTYLTSIDTSNISNFYLKVRAGLGNVALLNTNGNAANVLNGSGSWVAFVSSFNGRTGAVVPASGDYAIADVTGLTSALAAKLPAADSVNYALRHPTANIQTSSYTLVLSDDGKWIVTNSASANNITIPPHSSVALPVGALINITQLNTGQTTVLAGAGVTIKFEFTGANKLLKDGSTATLYQLYTDYWIAAGSFTL